MFRIHQYILKHKIPAFAVMLAFIGAISFLASGISLEEDISNLVPSGERQNTLRKVLDQTEFSDKIIVTVSSTSEEPDPEQVTQYAQQFLDSVTLHLPQYIEDVQGKVPEEGIREVYNFVYRNLPMFLNESDYAEISSRLSQDSLRERLQENYKMLISPTGLVTKDFIFKDPLSITSLGLRKLQELQIDDDFELYNNFLITKDQRHVLLFLSMAIPASETEENAMFLNRLGNIQANLNREFSGVEGNYFGGALYSIANAQQIKNDIQLTLGVAAGILLFILIFYYRRVYVPLLLFLPVVIGGITAIAFLFLIKGTVSAISLGIGAILLGISIDYSLHILTHFKNNRNLEKLYRDVTKPVIMSSCTTALAFLCLLFVRSEALNDLGIFAAVSVIVSSLFALVLIPLLYKTPENAKENPTLIDKISSFNYHQNKPLVVLFSILFLIGLFSFTRVSFNSDLSKLNYEPEEIWKKEQLVQNIAGRATKSIYLVSYGNSIDEALEYNNSLYGKLVEMDSLGQINNFSSIGGVILSTSTQLERIAKWQEFWDAGRYETVKEHLINESRAFGFKPQSFDSFYKLVNSDFEPLYLEDYRNTSTLYLDDFISVGENFATVTTSINVEPGNAQIISQIFNEKDNTVVIDRKQLNESFLGSLKDDFNRLIGYSLLAVFLALLLFYRSLEITILTLLPIGITWVIALGLMALFGIEFNILNIIISTFIFGLGLDYSIFITNAFLKEYETSTKVLKTYRTSILLSVLTTLLGIGALFFAKHPALRSISIVSIIGVLAAVSVAFVIQSFVLDRLFVRRKKQGKPAFNLSGIYYRSKFIGNENKLYLKKEVFDNYRFKKIFPEVKMEYEKDKERYLKIAEFLNKEDSVFHIYSGYGILPVFLTYKIQPKEVLGFEPDPEKFQVAVNTFRNNLQQLTFIEKFRENIKGYNTVILSPPSIEGEELHLKDVLSSTVKKIVILDAKYSYRWLTDHNFEIIYRQNDVVMLKRE